MVTSIVSLSIVNLERERERHVNLGSIFTELYCVRRQEDTSRQWINSWDKLVKE